jgi:uncharacterized metal-binding protein (TIGR02443 family)
MPDKPSRRRFIAGAVCPRCALADKIVVDMDTDQRQCVSCGFSEGRPGLPASNTKGAATHPPSELSTRVSRAAARRVETPAETITVLDPDQGRDKP